MLQSVVPGAQEDRRSATCNRPIHSQPPHGSATLQDGDARVRPFSHQKPGVDGIDRYTRCISSCANALAVKAARCEATRLLRGLADQGRYSGTGSTARPDNHQGAPVSWLDHQLREVRSHTKSRLPVHRDAVQHSTFHSGAPAENAFKGPVSSSALDGQSEHNSQRSAQTSRHAGVHGFAGPAKDGSVFVQPNGGPPKHGARAPGTGPTGFKFHSGFCQRWHGGHPQQSCKVYPSSPRRRK